MNPQLGGVVVGWGLLTAVETLPLKRTPFWRRPKTRPLAEMSVDIHQ